MKFIVDRMLGKLAKNLRMLGYDTLYYRGETPHPLIQLGRQESRIILTRNMKLLPKRPMDWIIQIREDNPVLQLKELIKKELISLEGGTLFSRCLLCNALLDEIPRKEVEGKVPDFIFSQQKEFFQCPQCQKIFWQGSHRMNMEQWVKNLRISTQYQAPNHK